MPVRIPMPSGWRPDISGRWYKAGGIYSVQFMCRWCGRVTRGIEANTEEHGMHRPHCPAPPEDRIP